MKLNKGHLSSELLSFISEINLSRNKFQKLLNSVHNSAWKCFQICTCTVLFEFLFTLTLAMKLKDVNYESSWSILVFCDQWKMTSSLNMSHEKMSDFISFFIVRVPFSHKTEKFWFWKSLKYFFHIMRKCMTSDLTMSQGKMSHSFLISIAWVPFSHKTEKFWVWKSLKFFNIFS